MLLRKASLAKMRALTSLECSTSRFRTKCARRNKTAELSGKNVGLMSALTRAQEENAKAKTSKENSAKVSRLQEELTEAHKKNVEVMEMASTANREKEKAKTELETTSNELKNAKAALKNLRESCANLENKLKTAQKAAEINGHARSSLIISRYKKRRRERERVKEEG